MLLRTKKEASMMEHPREKKNAVDVDDDEDELTYISNGLTFQMSLVTRKLQDPLVKII